MYRLCQLLAVAVVALGIGAPAAFAQVVDPLAGINAIRAEVGLPAVGATPKNVPLTEENRVVPVGGDLRTEIGNDAGALALALDPRLVGVRSYQWADGSEVIIFGRDLRTPFPTGRMIVWPCLVDPAVTGNLVVLSAATTQGSLSVRLANGNALSMTPATNHDRRGAVQITSLYTGPSSGLPWGEDITLSLDGAQGSFRTTTRPAPTRFRPVFIGLTPRQRAMVEQSWKKGPPLLRDILLPQVLGSLTVTGPRPSFCGGYLISCYSGSITKATISLARPILSADIPENRFVVLHELGHAISASGLSAAERDRFGELLRASPAYRCVPNRLLKKENGSYPCLSDEEWFADEFARWASHGRWMFSGYGTRPALSSRQFAAFLRSAFAARP